MKALIDLVHAVFPATGLVLALLWVPASHGQTVNATDNATIAGTASADTSRFADAETGNQVYLSLGPSFITNYDGGARLKYLKSDVSVRVHATLEDIITHHLPYIRNRLVVLLSAQLEENLTSTQGREALRRQALEEIREALWALESEVHASQLVDLYFTSFVVQR